MDGNRNKNSVLVAGIPRSRGVPVHYEHGDLTTAYVISNNQGVVEEIHTPQDIFPRVHEFMHARHTTREWLHCSYPPVNWIVYQVVEDCRIHILHWPWHPYQTPELILDGTKKWLRDDIKTANAAIKAEPKVVGTFPDFATWLRQSAIRYGCQQPFVWGRFASDGQRKLAQRCLDMILSGHAKEVATILQNAFFGPLSKTKVPPMDIDGPLYQDDQGEAHHVTPYDEPHCPPMKIIELDHTVPIQDAHVGYRRATMGPRLHRPSLRKPVLPQRLFVKRAPVEPQGTILIDASGSMGSFNEVTEWVKKAPFGTVAYYAGNNHYGQLFVYARYGKRAANIAHPNDRGNSVDSRALDWLLSQPGPRTYVTDREFCGAEDSFETIVRLERVEREGLVTVVDYSKKS